MKIDFQFKNKRLNILLLIAKPHFLFGSKPARAKNQNTFSRNLTPRIRYDPVIGRFYSNDPVGALCHGQREEYVKGFNRYAYTYNNPYKYTDPDGKLPRIDIAARNRLDRVNSGEITPQQAVNEQTEIAQTTVKGVLEVASYVPGPTGLVATGVQIAAEAADGDVPVSSGSSAILSETTGQLGNAIDKVESKTPGGFKAKVLTYVAEQAVGLGVENLRKTLTIS
ncbi:RHS repeat-associated core domain-containing protein [Glaciecola siphonariae]|uniref:RHS repeat-associated core domain-containing protein n=1 Tax=Glaciecola siphonariae TaxID=521012 RepID=A0ABV9LXU7_9ALTE